MAQSALLVIDAQESFRRRPYWSEADYPAYVTAQQRLVDDCVARGIPVVSVFHVGEDADFSLASGHVRTLAELSIKADLTVHKYVHSALFSEQLRFWFTTRGISHLIISGIRTEQCCETTTRAAFDSGFTVDYVLDATLTFPMTRNGKTFDTASIKERTALVLEGRFARICDAASVFAEHKAA